MRAQPRMPRDKCEKLIKQCIEDRDYARSIGDVASEETQKNRLHSLHALLARFGPAAAEAIVVG